MKSLKGIFAALVTPFKPSGEVDYDVLSRVVEHLLERGLDGFYVCGSTGESLLLSVEEREKILETVIKQNNGRGAVIAHTGSIGTGLTIALSQHAKAAGADAISAVTPFYYKFSAEEIVGFYNEVATAVAMPTIVYNFPGLTGYALSMSNVNELSKNPHIAGIKYTSLDLFTLERFKHKHPNLIVYNGHDEVLLYGLMAGADGGIGSTYNFMPEKYRKLIDLHAAGKLDEAAQVQHEINDAIDLVVKYDSISVAKEILTLKGFACGDRRSPFKPLTAAGRKEIKEFYETKLK